MSHGPSVTVICNGSSQHKQELDSERHFNVMYYSTSFLFAKLQLNSQLNLHFKSIQLLQELSWSYALYVTFGFHHHYHHHPPTHHITFLN